MRQLRKRNELRMEKSYSILARIILFSRLYQTIFVIVGIGFGRIELFFQQIQFLQQQKESDTDG